MKCPAVVHGHGLIIILELRPEALMLHIFSVAPPVKLYQFPQAEELLLCLVTVCLSLPLQVLNMGGRRRGGFSHQSSNRLAGIRRNNPKLAEAGKELKTGIPVWTSRAIMTFTTSFCPASIVTNWVDDDLSLFVETENYGICMAINCCGNKNSSQMFTAGKQGTLKKGIT